MFNINFGMSICLPNIDVQRIGQRLLEAVDLYEYSGMNMFELRTRPRTFGLCINNFISSDG